MNKTSILTISLLAFAGAAYSQRYDDYFQRGSLLRQPNNQDGIAVQTQRENAQTNANNYRDWNAGMAVQMRQQFATCTEQEQRKGTNGNPYTCRYLKNQEEIYNQRANQRQYNTANQSQALQNSWFGAIPGVRIPVVTIPSHAAEQAPEMPRFSNSSGGFPVPQRAPRRMYR
jgi:hypothetical protein